MKNILLLLMVGFVSLLVACGEESSSTYETNDNNSSSKQEETTANESKEEPKEKSKEQPKEMTAEENKNTEATVGDVVKTEAGKMTLVSRTDDIGTFQSGPINLTIKKVNGVSGEIKGDMAEMIGTDQLEYIQVDMKVENTSEETVNFYASQATLVTNTGEQLESDMLFSDHIEGEYLGQVKKEGSSYYILENSKAKDVTSVRLVYEAAQNQESMDIGDKIDTEVELKK